MSAVAFLEATEAILDSLLAARGSAYDTDTGSIVYAECEAVAMAIASAWDTNRRLACQFDPSRMSDFLPRWERIFGLRPAPDATLPQRRELVALKFMQLGQMPNGSALSDLLATILPDTFLSIVHTPSTTATVHVTAGATIPGGITAAADGLWSSGIAFVAIETEQPSGMTNAAYRREVGAVHAWLHDALPAWVEFGTFRDGVSGPGFFLDESRNLDEQRFAT